MPKEQGVAKLRRQNAALRKRNIELRSDVAEANAAERRLAAALEEVQAKSRANYERAERLARRMEAISALWRMANRVLEHYQLQGTDYLALLVAVANLSEPLPEAA